jgi:hypothetical protein
MGNKKYFGHLGGKGSLIENVTGYKGYRSENTTHYEVTVVVVVGSLRLKSFE